MSVAQGGGVPAPPTYDDDLAFRRLAIHREPFVQSSADDVSEVLKRIAPTSGEFGYEIASWRSVCTR